MPRRRDRTDGKPKQSRIVKHQHPAVTTRPSSHPRHSGAPEVIVDEAQLYEAALTHASYEQLGRIFGVGAQTLSVKYGPLIKKARAERQKALLSAQFTTAIDDRNPTMQIWLGKQYLDQKDVRRVEATGADGQPIQSEQLQKIIAYIPENNRDK